MSNSTQTKELASHLNAYLTALSERDLEVAINTILSGGPINRREVGESHGISRERVRQIQNKIRQDLKSIADNYDIVETINNEINNVSLISVDDLYMLDKNLKSTLSTANIDLLFALSTIYETFEIKDGWAYIPQHTKSLTAIKKSIKEVSDEYGVCSFEDLEAVNIPKQWALSCGYVMYKDKILTNTSSCNNHAAAVLSVNGEPTTVLDLLDQVDRKATRRSLTNSLTQDPRIIRVNKNTWALAEWGIPEYKNIVDTMERIIAEHGGKISRDTLFDIMLDSYNVTNDSITNYLYSGPFTTKDDIITARKNKVEHKKHRAQLSDTKYVYRIPGGWAQLRNVTRDHVRGSGSHLPVAIDSLLNLPIGDTKRLTTPLGDVTVKWNGAQIFIGSVKKFVDSYGLVPGDKMLFVFSEDGTHFNVHPVSEEENTLEHLLSRMGVPENEPATFESVSSALGLDKNSTIKDIKASLSKRKETDTLKLVEQIEKNSQSSTFTKLN